MARPALVVDASVGVKWFSDRDEASLDQAVNIMNAHVAGRLLILAPDLFFYEVANAIRYKQHIPLEAATAIVVRMFELDINVVPVGAALLGRSLEISRQFGISIYDSCYISLAVAHSCPLVTANPRHQKQDVGCEVIPVEKWRLPTT